MQQQEQKILKQWNKSSKIEMCIRISQDTYSWNGQRSKIWNQAQIVEEESDQTPSTLKFDLLFFKTNSEFTNLTRTWIVSLHFVQIMLLLWPFSVSAE